MSDEETLQPTHSLGIWYSFLRWFDSWAGLELTKSDGPPKVDWVRSVPFIALHLMCLGVLWVGWSWTAVAVTIAFYYIRMFAITGWYHRYFSHRTFKTSRTVQFLFALLGSSCTQRGPLWWPAIIVIITLPPTLRRMCIPLDKGDFFGRTWAGLCRRPFMRQG